jgi:CHAT domain-containing protein/tetratricopeptide (TPR) repeat protein
MRRILFLIFWGLFPTVSAVFPGASADVRLSDTPPHFRLFVKGIVACQANKFEKAQQYLEAAQPRIDASATGLLRGYLHYFLGETYRGLNRLEKSKQAFSAALQFLPENPYRIAAFQHLGELYFQINSFQSSVKYYQAALRLSQQLADTLEQLQSLERLGESHFRQGELSLAHVNYRQALTLAQESAHPEYEAKFLNAVGFMYYYFGEFDDALETLLLALKKSQSLPPGGIPGEIHSNLGNVYRAGNDSSLAKYHYLAALQNYHQNQDYSGQITTLIRVGELLFEFKAFEKSLKIFFLANQLQQRFQYTNEACRIYLGLAQAYRELGEFSLSQNYYEQARAAALKSRQSDYLWRTRLGLAQLFERQQKFKAALDEYREGIRLVETMREKIHLPGQRTGYFEKTIPLYENFIRLLLQTNLTDSTRVREAFHYMERFRARSFLENSQVQNYFHSVKMDSMLVRRRFFEQELFQVLAEIEQNSRQHTANDSLRIRLFRERNELETWLQIVDIEIAAETRPFRLPVDQLNSVLVLEEIQTALKAPDLVILEYFLSDPYSFVWVISKNQFAIYQIAPKQKILEQLQILLPSISYPEKRFEDFVEKPSQRLYKMLVEPVAPQLKPNQELLIIPDGELSYLPFELLRLPDEIPPRQIAGIDCCLAPRRFLVEQHRIDYAPSTSVYLGTSARGNSRRWTPKEILLIGDGTEKPPKSASASANFTWPFSLPKPLFYSKSELENISQYFLPQRVTTLVDSMATESHLKQLSDLADYRILHFATHGVIHENSPELSGLLINRGDAQNDGFLRIPEIYPMKLNAELVVLSGCQTGWGKLARSNGVESLARAFMHAGTSAVIVSLWNVDDRSTSLFMRKLYHYFIRESLPLADALAMTKVDMLNSTEFQHPYYWAPFVLINTYQK